MDRGNSPGVAGVVDIYEDDHIDPPTSHALSWIVIALWLFALVATLRGRSRCARLAREADVAFDESAPLALGQRFVSGAVELAQGESIAVTVHIKQTGTESKNKNNWSHRWKEVERTVHSRPFYVRRPDGGRVRVEPGANVHLVDSPDKTVTQRRDLRIRIAELTPGETVIVEGVLGRTHDPELREGSGYRGTTDGWVMRPEPGKRLHLSAEPLGDRHRRKAKSHRTAAIAILGLGVVIQVSLLTYHARTFLGETTVAAVAIKDHYTTKGSKGSTHHHWRVFLTLESAGAPRLSRELDRDDWMPLQPGARIAYRDVPSFRAASSPGRGSSVYAGAWTLALFILFGSAVVSWGAAGSVKWYEGDLNEGGRGRLPEVPPGPHASNPAPGAHRLVV